VVADNLTVESLRRFKDDGALALERVDVAQQQVGGQ
jgi:hypothetical protein